MKIATALCAALLLLAGCSAGTAATKVGGGASVAIRVFAFRPTPVHIRAGTAVTWTNGDAILHTVTAGTPDHRLAAFNGVLDGKGKTFTFTFDKPGPYPYFCTRHPTVMRGEVVVTSG